MKDIIIKTQKEYDALPKSFPEYTRIIIQETGGARLNISRVPENAHAELLGNAHAVLLGNAHAVLWGNAHAELWGNAHAELRGNAHAVLRGDAHAELWGNAHAVLWDNAHAEVYGCASVHLQSDFASAVLFMFAVCWILANGKVTKKSTNATVITPKFRPETEGWLYQQGIDDDGEMIILYKRVSEDLKTMEGTQYETVWTIGATLEHPRWNPGSDECGDGKFHACSKPYFCDEFRDIADDRYIALEVRKSDMYAWPNPAYPHKIAVQTVRVLYECDRYGRKL